MKTKIINKYLKNCVSMLVKVGVFYTKLGERNGNNDHIIVRVVNRAKQNLTMYSIKFFRWALFK